MPKTATGFAKIVIKGKSSMMIPRMKKITHDSMRLRCLDRALIIFGHI
jgi:hypothetical protein